MAGCLLVVYWLSIFAKTGEKKRTNLDLDILSWITLPFSFVGAVS